MERHSKGEFHVLIEALKLFDHEFFFKHIAPRHFDFSQRSLTVFALFFNRLHFILLNNFFRFGVEFFSTPNCKKYFQVPLRKVKNFFEVDPDFNNAFH